MRINPYCIFSEVPPSPSAAKSSSAGQVSILRDLDPVAAKFSSDEAGAKNRGYIWGGALLISGGVAAWLLFSPGNMTDARAIVGDEKKTEAASPRSLDNKNEGGSIGSLASDTIAPAVIHDLGLPRSDGGAAIDAPVGMASAGIDQGFRAPLPLVVEKPVMASGADVGRGRPVKKNERGSRSPASTAVLTRSKMAEGATSRAAQKERQATERDIDIITVLVK